MNSVYLITGVMASGKSTVAEIVAQRLEKAIIFFRLQKYFLFCSKCLLIYC